MATKTRSGQPGKQGSTSQLTPDEEDVLFKLRLQEALDDEQVAKRLARIIRSVNQDLLDGITSLRAEVQSLKAQLNDRDAKIASLKGEVRKVREDHDALEQYGRRHNLRISGLPEPQLEPDQAEDTTGTIVQLANDVIKLDPLRHNLRISGLPEPQLEPDQAEDTTGTIVQLANDVIKLDPPPT